MLNGLFKRVKAKKYLLVECIAFTMRICKDLNVFT